MKQLVTFNDINEYLAEFSNNLSSYNLKNIKILMEYLGNPQDKYKTIHVAGTSGKTSTAYFMAGLLIESGKKVGLTVSPVVDEVNERVQINLEPLSEKEFIAAFKRYINLLTNVSVKPSRFEIVIAFAFWYFADQKVDYAVIEVGLGGLNDATNVISRPDKVCLITDIGYDHVHILGNSLAEIAGQKAGIIGASNEVFMYEQPQEVVAVIKNRARSVKANVNLLKGDLRLDHSMPLYQRRNWGLAYAGFKYIEYRDGLIALNIDKTERSMHLQVPARMDIKRHGNKIIILDGAHNPQKIAAFISSFKDLFPGIKPAVLIALGPTKNYQDIADQISSFTDSVIVTSFSVSGASHKDSLPAKTLASSFSLANCKYIQDPIKAFNTLSSSTKEILVITGSLYLIGQLRQEIDYLK